MPMKISDFNELVVLRFSQELTDRVFLMIQEDRELMQIYLDAVAKHGKRSVNSNLAKAARKRFHTKLPDPKVAVPRSSLINSYKEL